MKRRSCAASIVCGALLAPLVTTAQVTDHAVMRVGASSAVMVMPPATRVGGSGLYPTLRVASSTGSPSPRGLRMWGAPALPGTTPLPAPRSVWPAVRNGALIGAGAGLLASVIWASSTNCNTGDVSACGFYYAVGIPTGVVVGAIVGLALSR